ncbi:sensor histidine kinase [Flavobacterium branchiophilum]|nr:histidine kinase [Flavobacterium branchiophilum]
MKKIVLICLLMSFQLFGQSRFFKYAYTTDDGLPSNTIYDIKESPNGIITLGTDNGISFFDGLHFQNLNTSDGLNKPYVIGLQYNKKGDLLIGNYNGKCQIFKNNRFYTTPIDALTVDEVFFLKNNEICVKTYISNFNSKTKSSEINIIFSFYKNNKLDKSIFYLNNPEYNKPLVFNYLYETKSFFEAQNELPFSWAIPANEGKIYVIKKRKNDWVFVANQHLFIVDSNGHLLEKVALPYPLLNEVNRFGVEIDNENNIWLLLQKKGLFRYSNQKWDAIHPLIGLNSNQNINKIFKDSKGRMWIATNENGLICVPNTAVFQYFTPNKLDFFKSFFVLDQALYVSNRYQFLQINKTNLSPIAIPQSSDFSLGYFKGTPVFFAFNANYHCKKVYKNVMAFNFKKYCSLKNNQYLYYTSNELYLSDDHFGNENYILNPNNFRYYNVVNHHDTIYYNVGNQLFIGEIEKPNLIKKKILFDSKGFISDMVFKGDTLLIAEDKKLHFWFKDKIIKTISTVNDASFEIINKIMIQKNDIWLATKNGLFKLNANHSFVFNKYNYLPNNDVTDIHFYKNNLFVATSNGLAKIPFSVFSTLQEPLHFTVKNYKTNQLHVLKGNTIFLNTDDDYLKILFQITNYLSPKNQIIQYKLDQSNWINIPTNYLELLKLPYGTSKVLIRIKDINSSWNTQQIVIEKAYPFYLKWWFGLGGIMLFLSIIYAVFRIELHRQKTKQDYENEVNLKMAELKQSALSAMMNPHFVFNSLNAIQYYVNTNQTKQSSDYLGKLSKLIRLFLLHASETFITLDEEIKRLQLYMELEQLRFSGFAFYIKLAVQNPPQEILIPNMIIQPFLENAVLHGISQIDDGSGQIDLNIFQNQNQLTIEIVDNGYGLIEKPTHKSHVSKGMSIIAERIGVLQQRFPNKIYSITKQPAFENEQRCGFKITIQLTI